MRIMLTLQVDVDLATFAECKGFTHARDAAGYAIEYLPAALLVGAVTKMADDGTEGVTVHAVNGTGR